MKKMSGMNLRLQDECSVIAAAWAQESRQKLHALDQSDTEAFATLCQCGDSVIGITSDGIGTKIEIAERMGCYRQLGYDLVAMVVDDLISVGVVPTTISNVLDVDYLDSAIVNELMEGLHNAAVETGVTISGGEIAELGPRVRGYGKRMHFNWSATAIGYLPKNRQVIDGSKIAPGDYIISLASSGFHCNGFSLIRKTMKSNFGDNWHEAPFDENTSWGKILLTPSRIYAPIINELFKQNIPINGITHITGGGLPRNLYRILKINNFIAQLDNLPKPPEMFSRMAGYAHVPMIETGYKYWNMGIGMVLIVDPSVAKQTLSVLEQQRVEAHVIGITVK